MKRTQLTEEKEKGSQGTSNIPTPAQPSFLDCKVRETLLTEDNCPRVVTTQPSLSILLIQSNSEIGRKKKCGNEVSSGRARATGFLPHYFLGWPIRTVCTSYIHPHRLLLQASPPPLPCSLDIPSVSWSGMPAHLANSIHSVRHSPSPLWGPPQPQSHTLVHGKTEPQTGTSGSSIYTAYHYLVCALRQWVNLTLIGLSSCNMKELDGI